MPSRQDWIGSPNRRPPWEPSQPADWRNTLQSGVRGQQTYPPDYGLPIMEEPRRSFGGAGGALPPLEEEGADLDYGPQLMESLGAKASRNKTTLSFDPVYSKNNLDNSSSHESNGSHSSGHGSTSPKAWTKKLSEVVSSTGRDVKQFGKKSRMSPDEGIQTDCGTDV